MEWWKILLCIVINAIWIIPLFFELLSSVAEIYKYKKQIRADNKEYNKMHGKRLRKLCINCSYCGWKYYHPFSYGKYYWHLVSKIPHYCKKFKEPLNPDSSLRCISELHSMAMFENDD